MKVSLNRFSPKGIPAEQVTFGEMLEKMFQQKFTMIPTANQLLESDFTVIYHYVDAECDITLFENGLVFYRYPSKDYTGKMKWHYNVIPVFKMKYKQEFVTSTSAVTVPLSEYTQTPFVNWIKFLALLQQQQNDEYGYKKNVDFFEEDAENQIIANDNGYAEIEKTEDMKFLKQKIQELSQEQQEAVKLYYFKKMKQREVAEKLNIGRTSVLSRLENAKSALRKNPELRNLLYY